MHIYMKPYTYLCTDTYMHACIHRHIHAVIHTCMHVCIHKVRLSSCHHICDYLIFGQRQVGKNGGLSENWQQVLSSFSEVSSGLWKTLLFLLISRSWETLSLKQLGKSSEGNSEAAGKAFCSSIFTMGIDRLHFQRQVPPPSPKSQKVEK